MNPNLRGVFALAGMAALGNEDAKRAMSGFHSANRKAIRRSVICSFIPAKQSHDGRTRKPGKMGSLSRRQIQNRSRRLNRV